MEEAEEEETAPTPTGKEGSKSTPKGKKAKATPESKKGKAAAPEPDPEPVEEEVEEPAADGLTAKEVQGMKVAELKAECVKRNLPTDGLKKVLADRLIASL